MVDLISYYTIISVSGDRLIVYNTTISVRGDLFISYYTRISVSGDLFISYNKSIILRLHIKFMLISSFVSELCIWFLYFILCI